MSAESTGSLTASLRVVGGKSAGQLIELPTGKFLVGREEDCHLRPNSDLVSRHHCVFIVDAYAARLRDLGSTNGTRVNGEPLHGAVGLKSGDTVAFGNLEFEVVLSTADAEAGLETEPLDSGNAETQEVHDTESPAPADTLAEDSLTDTDVIPGGETLVDIPANIQDFAGSDTTFSPPPGQPPMQQPMFGYPPQMPYGMPPQGYPGYGQQYPMPGYPPPGYMMPGYPQPGYPQPGYPQQPPPEEPAAEEEAPEPDEQKSDNSLALRLPNPSETGAKTPEPKPEKPADGSGKPANIPDAASKIIKQYLERRPGQ